MAEEALGAFFNELLGRCVSIECTRALPSALGQPAAAHATSAAAAWHRTDGLSAVFVNDNEGVPMIQGETPSRASCTGPRSTARSSTGAEAESVLPQSCSQTPG